MNSSHIYTEVPLAYERLIHFCENKKFIVDPSSKQFFLIMAKKRSFFFWRTLRLKLEINTIEKKQVLINTEILRNGNRQFQLEKTYISEIEKLF